MLHYTIYCQTLQYSTFHLVMTKPKVKKYSDSAEVLAKKPQDNTQTRRD